MEDFSFISRKKVIKTTDTACGFLPAVDVVHRVTKPDITLKAYEEENVLKLFMHDTGLLSALSGIDFLLEFGENIIPFEVKSGINTKAKRLSAYREKYSPTLSLNPPCCRTKTRNGWSTTFRTSLKAWT